MDLPVKGYVFPHLTTTTHVFDYARHYGCAITYRTYTYKHTHLFSFYEKL